MSRSIKWTCAPGRRRADGNDHPGEAGAAAEIGPAKCVGGASPKLRANRQICRVQRCGMLAARPGLHARRQRAAALIDRQSRSAPGKRPKRIAASRRAERRRNLIAAAARRGACAPASQERQRGRRDPFDARRLAEGTWARFGELRAFTSLDRPGKAA